MIIQKDEHEIVQSNELGNMITYKIVTCYFLAEDIDQIKADPTALGNAIISELESTNGGS